MSGEEMLLACRPVQLDLSDPMDAEAARLTIVYDGSVKGVCALCGQEVWVGPRQQAHLAEHPATEVRCFKCAVVAQIAGGGEYRNLGNPEPNPNMTQAARKAAKEALKRMAEQFPAIDGLVYRGAGDFLLQHGRWYTPKLYSKPLPPGHCYGSAIFLAATQPDTRYVEGVAVSPKGDELIPHAWITQKGQAWELTWRQLGWAYLGVEFSLGRADDATWDGDACVLDDANRGWPLYQQRWRGERWDQEWPDNDRLRLLRLVADGKATLADYISVLQRLEAEVADG